MHEGRIPRILRRRQVEAQTGLSRSAIYEGVLLGTFPRPIHIGTRAVGWLAHEVDAWLAVRIAESRSGAVNTANTGTPGPATPSDDQERRPKCSIRAAERDENGAIYSGPDVSRRAASFPEHKKLKAVQEKSQIIGEFLDWLQNEQAVVLTKAHQHSEFCREDGERVCGAENGTLVPVISPIPRWLARYFDIDEEKLESEKRRMLDELRSGASTG